MQFLRSLLQRYTRLSAVATYGAMLLVSRMVGALLVLLYVRVLPIEEFAAYGILTAVLAALVLIVDLGIPGAVLRTFFARSEQAGDARAFLSSILHSAGIASLAIMPFMALGLFLVWKMLGTGLAQFFVFIPLLLTIVYLDRGLELRAAICRALEQPAQFAYGRLAQSFGTIIAAVFLVWYLRLGVMGTMLAALAGRIAGGLVYRIVLGVEARASQADWANLKDCLAFGLPLVPNRLAAWGREMALRPILTHFVPMAAVGMFAMASSLAAIPMIATVGIEQALVPIYFRARAQSDEFRDKTRRFAGLYLAILFPAAVVGVVFASEIVTAFAGERYSAAYPACAVLFCAALVRSQCSFFSRQLSFLLKTWIFPLVSVPCTAISVGLTVWLAPSWGILAAAVAVLLSDFAILIGLVVAVRRYERLEYPLLALLGLCLVLWCLTCWVVCGKPVPAGFSPLIGQVAAVLLALGGAMAFSIWPNRRFLCQIASR